MFTKVIILGVINIDYNNCIIHNTYTCTNSNCYVEHLTTISWFNHQSGSNLYYL